MICSSVTVAVLKLASSIITGTDVLVVIEPELLFVADAEVVNASEFAQLKQYSVPTIKSPLGKVTICAADAVAVPIPGHAMAVAGQAVLVVLTVQLPTVPDTV
jgi:hypothetical protein